MKKIVMSCLVAFVGFNFSGCTQTNAPSPQIENSSVQDNNSEIEIDSSSSQTTNSDMKKFSGFKQPQNGNAMVYIYNSRGTGGIGVLSLVNGVTGATSSYAGSYGAFYRISYDGKDYVFGNVGRGYERYMEVPANKTIEFWSENIDKKASVSINTVSGEIYCLKASIGSGIVRPRPHIESVDFQTCQNEIANLIDANYIDLIYNNKYNNKEKFKDFIMPQQGKSMLYIIKGDHFRTFGNLSAFINDGTNEINLGKMKKDEFKHIELLADKEYYIYTEDKLITKFKTKVNQISCMISSDTESGGLGGINFFNEVGIDNCSYYIAERQRKLKEEKEEKEENDPRKKYGF